MSFLCIYIIMGPCCSIMPHSIPNSCFFLCPSSPLSSPSSLYHGANLNELFIFFSSWNYLSYDKILFGYDKILNNLFFMRLELEDGVSLYFKVFTVSLNILLGNIVVCNIDIFSYVVSIRNKLISRIRGKRIVISIQWRSWAGCGQVCFNTLIPMVE